MSQRYLSVLRLLGGMAVVGMLVTAGVAYATVPTLSQSGVTIALGQSLTVTATNGVSVYLYSNSAPTMVTVSVNGSQIVVTGQALGSATIDLCAQGTASDCTNLNVIVQSTVASGISFSQSNLSLSAGGNQSVTVSGGNGTYTISNNSNTSAVSTSLSGSALTVSGLAAGNATITACDTSNTCGTLSVTVNAANTSGLTFGQNNISLAASNSQTVSISGGNGSYLISNISNPSAVSAGTSGSGIIVFASAAGSGTIKVCDTSNVCGTLNVTVTAAAANSAVVFSTTNPSVAVGQSLNVTITGGAISYIVLANQNPGVAQASMTTNSTLSITGITAGTDSLTICATGGGGCNPLPVTVTGSTSASATSAPTTSATVTASPTTPAVAAAATPIVQPSSAVANTALLTEIQTMQTVITQVLSQIQIIQSQLNQLEAQVNAGSGSNINTNVSAAADTSAGTLDFTELLTLGSQDAQVTALQRQLTALGLYSGPITGYYGSLTDAAVAKYQTLHGITATGSLTPSTRAALNTGN